jgi:ubiquitin-like 1-activating enzyme E1 B
VDISRATLGDLVKDFLRLELGYGEEIVVNHGADLLYDVEETDNLTKKLGELGTLSGLLFVYVADKDGTGIKGDSFLTIIDEDEENPRVNLVLNIQES